jgi:hypothetical protein
MLGFFAHPAWPIVTEFGDEAANHVPGTPTQIPVQGRGGSTTQSMMGHAPIAAALEEGACPSPRWVAAPWPHGSKTARCRWEEKLTDWPRALRRRLPTLRRRSWPDFQPPAPFLLPASPSAVRSQDGRSRHRIGGAR